jgi:hypothetical protein
LDALRTPNLATKFTIEIAALVAFAYSGASVGRAAAIAAAHRAGDLANPCDSGAVAAVL